MSACSFFAVLLFGIISCENKKNIEPNNELIRAWQITHEIIPEFRTAILDLDEDIITVEEFKEIYSDLLESYRLFFDLLERNARFKRLYNNMLIAVSNYQYSDDKIDMQRIYSEIDKFNTEWTNTYYDEESLNE